MWRSILFLGIPIWLIYWMDWDSYFLAREERYEKLKVRGKQQILKEGYLIGTQEERDAIKSTYERSTQTRLEFHKLMTNNRVGDGAFTVATLVRSGFTAEQLREAGYSADDLLLAGVTRAELRRSGYTDLDLSDFTTDFTDPLLSRSHTMPVAQPHYAQIPINRSATVQIQPVSQELRTSGAPLARQHTMPISRSAPASSIGARIVMLAHAQSPSANQCTTSVFCAG